MLERAIFAANRPQLADPPLFSTQAFQNGLQDRNSDISGLIDNNFCIHQLGIW